MYCLLWRLRRVAGESAAERPPRGLHSHDHTPTPTPPASRHFHLPALQEKIERKAPARQDEDPARAVSSTVQTEKHPNNSLADNTPGPPHIGHEPAALAPAFAFPPRSTSTHAPRIVRQSRPDRICHGPPSKRRFWNSAGPTPCSFHVRLTKPRVPHPSLVFIFRPSAAASSSCDARTSDAGARAQHTRTHTHTRRL